MRAASNNGLFYAHSDHLGSAALLTAASGANMGGTLARYLPFGQHRTTPTATIEAAAWNVAAALAWSYNRDQYELWKMGFLSVRTPTITARQ
ncbi:MAG: hypothetical protein ACRDIB_08845, partial [Ardenticatenaceae bacterium]